MKEIKRAYQEGDLAARHACELGAAALLLTLLREPATLDATLDAPWPM